MRSRVRRGTGQIIGAVALDYAFRGIGLRRVRGEAAAFNVRSVVFHRRLGSTVEDVGSEKTLEDGTPRRGPFQPRSK